MSDTPNQNTNGESEVSELTTEQTSLERNRRILLRGLDRIAFYFETDDPHLRHEAHLVAKQNLSEVAREASNEQ